MLFKSTDPIQKWRNQCLRYTVFETNIHQVRDGYRNFERQSNLHIGGRQLRRGIRQMQHMGLGNPTGRRKVGSQNHKIAQDLKEEKQFSGAIAQGCFPTAQTKVDARARLAKPGSIGIRMLMHSMPERDSASIAYPKQVP